jgi:protein-S-isoprenylcysteine O-methyltransferase Ste14
MTIVPVARPLRDRATAVPPAAPRRVSLRLSAPRIAGLLRLIRAAAHPPLGAGRIALALATGAVTHLAFAAAVTATIAAMFFGLSASFGRVPAPWAWLANVALIVQFPLVHSVLLTRGGGRLLVRLVPGPHGTTLATTTYALIASLQLLALFTLWTPSGTVWWRAEGAMFWALCTAYAAAWLLLFKASFDARAEVQSGALGWMSLMARIAPRFPPMPTRGLFRVVRQPIYVAFALTLWTVPVWTPDHLALATTFTAYCLLAPRLKEHRLTACHGARFATVTVAEKILQVLPRGTHDPALFIAPRDLRMRLMRVELVTGQFVALGPRGITRRGDLTFGRVPLTAILYMGMARKAEVQACVFGHDRRGASYDGAHVRGYGALCVRLCSVPVHSTVRAPTTDARDQLNA